MASMKSNLPYVRDDESRMLVKRADLLLYRVLTSGVPNFSGAILVNGGNDETGCVRFPTHGYLASGPALTTCRTGYR